MEVTYHQEFKNIVLTLKDHSIPADQRHDKKDWSGKALFLGADAMVLDPVEGTGIGQYTPLKAGAPSAAADSKTGAETEASAELAKLREQLAAAEKAKAEAEARADSAEKAKAAAEQAAAKPLAPATAAQKPVK